jgi:hypothetical protein
MKNLKNPPMLQGDQNDLPDSRTTGRVARPKYALSLEVSDDPFCRTGAPKGLKQKIHRILNLPVRIQNHLLIAIVDIAYRWRDPEFSPSGFVQLPADESSSQHMKLGLAHRPL